MTTTNINYLPNEVLERVFIFAHPEVDVYHHPRFGGSSTWALSYVSKTWRSVVLGSKTLWSKLLLKGSPWYTLHPLICIIRLSSAVSRSSPVLFSVRVADPRSEASSGYPVVRDASAKPPSGILRETRARYEFERIFEDANRLEAFLEEGALPGGGYWALCVFPKSFYQLRVLQLSGNDVFHGMRGGNSFPLDAPFLRELRLSRFRLNQPNQKILFSTLQIPWSQITDFTADRCQFWELDPSEDDIFNLQPGEDHLFNLQQFLDNLPGLQHLTLLFGAEEKRWRSEVLFLNGENLETLNVRGASRVMVPLLTRIWTPNIQKLRLDLLDGPDTHDWELEDMELEGWDWEPLDWELEDAELEDGELEDRESEDAESGDGVSEDAESRDGDSEDAESEDWEPEDTEYTASEAV